MRIELTDEVKIANVRSLYNALSKEAKALVTNLDKLEALELKCKKLYDNKYELSEYIQKIKLY